MTRQPLVLYAFGLPVPIGEHPQQHPEIRRSHTAAHPEERLNAVAQYRTAAYGDLRVPDAVLHPVCRQCSEGGQIGGQRDDPLICPDI